VGWRARLQDPEVVHRRRWLTLAVLSVSVFVLVLDNSILNVALPTLARPESEGGLGATTSQLQWIIDAYTLVFAGLLLTAGSLGDRFGRYRALSVGLAVFGIGSGLSAFAGSPSTLILTRALMGVGGALVMPSTLSLLTNVFTDPRERAKAIGIWSGCAGLASVGPIIGGGLLRHFWWGSVFFVNLPVVLVGLVLCAVVMPESRDPSHPKLDPLGALLSIVGLGTALWAVIEGPVHGWTDGRVVGAFLVGALVLVAFFAWERSSRNPMLDLRFFRNPRFSAASGALALTFFALFGMLFAVTQYVQLVLGYSALKAGLVFLPQATLLLVLSPYSHVLVRRFGNKRVVAGGMFAVAVCMLGFQLLDEGSSTIQVMLVTAILSLGVANIMAPATDSIMGSLPRAKAGVGSAMNDTTRQLGGAVGVAVIGSVVASRFTGSIGAGLSGVPAKLVDEAERGIGSAVAVARTEEAAPFADQILDAARASFVSAMHSGMAVTALVVVVAALGVLVWLPAHATEGIDVPPAADPVDPVLDDDVVTVAE
jgi:EmrB/QacA subfamily drug resistance transporter